MTQLETAPYYRREYGKNRKKKHPPSLEPPQLGSLRNLLGLLRVRACAVRDPHRHHTRARKNRVDIFMRVSARAKDGRQRRPVQHKNRRRARFGVRPVRHPVKVQRRWRAVACWQCTMCVCGELGCCGMDPNHVHQSLVSKRVSPSLIKRMPELRPTFINRTHTGLVVVVVVVVAAAANASAAPTLLLLLLLLLAVVLLPAHARSSSRNLRVVRVTNVRTHRARARARGGQHR